MEVHQSRPHSVVIGFQSTPIWTSTSRSSSATITQEPTPVCTGETTSPSGVAQRSSHQETALRFMESNQLISIGRIQQSLRIISGSHIPSGVPTVESGTAQNQPRETLSTPTLTRSLLAMMEVKTPSLLCQLSRRILSCTCMSITILPSVKAAPTSSMLNLLSCHPKPMLKEPSLWPTWARLLTMLANKCAHGGEFGTPIQISTKPPQMVTDITWRQRLFHALSELSFKINQYLSKVKNSLVKK